MGQAPHLGHFTSRSFVSSIAAAPHLRPAACNDVTMQPFLATPAGQTDVHGRRNRKVRAAELRRPSHDALRMAPWQGRMMRCILRTHIAPFVPDT